MGSHSGGGESCRGVTVTVVGGVTMGEEDGSLSRHPPGGGGTTGNPRQAGTAGKHLAHQPENVILGGGGGAVPQR